MYCAFRGSFPSGPFNDARKSVVSNFACATVFVKTRIDSFFSSLINLSIDAIIFSLKLVSCEINSLNSSVISLVSVNLYTIFPSSSFVFLDNFLNSIYRPRLLTYFSES